MNQSIYLRRKNKIFIPEGSTQLELKYIKAFEQNIKPLGYKFSTELKKRMLTLNLHKLTALHKETVRTLHHMVGAYVEYHPMYPNFPHQVKNASELELYANAMFHYLGDAIGHRILPNYEVEQRGPLLDKIAIKVIQLGTEEDFKKIFTNLVSSKVAVSETDKEDILDFIKNYGSAIKSLIPEIIQNKENAAFVMGNIIKYTDIGIDYVENYIKTATDILRLAVAISDGDVSLASNTKFKSYSRKVRKGILSLLEKKKFITEDMLRYKEMWKRLGEVLHPQDKRFNFPLTVAAFDIVRNDKPFNSYYSNLQSLIKNKDFRAASLLLKERPGEFARRLDYLLRVSDDNEILFTEFENVADQISTTVLLAVMTHFKHRNDQLELRVFFPKGNIAKAYAINNELVELNSEDCARVIEICKRVLVNKFKKLPTLGKVYLDEQLKNYTVPFALRSASKTLKTVGRGSKFDLPAGDTIRFFLWWKDGNTRTDIDLSALGLDKNYNYKTTLSYYNLKDIGGYHSGDITSAPKGASEFIDIDISKFINSGIRYVIMSINSFTQQPYCDLPECFAGFMSRQHPNSGEIYDPRTVETKIDLTSDTRICIPAIIDLHERKVIWTDLALTKHPSYNNVHFNYSGINLMTRAMTSLVKPSLYDLFKLHIEARGTMVESRKEADIIFSEKEGITPYDVLQITANYL